MTAMATTMTHTETLPLDRRPDRIIMGVDPGVTGGLAFVSATTIEAFDIPVVAGEVDVDELVRIVKRFVPALAVVEKAGAMPKQGVASTFKYGVAYGALRAALVACGVPTHLIAASKWKKAYLLDRDKEKARALAIRFWPGCALFARKKDHGRAEAALLAKYGMDVLVLH
jgi:crossover junction endodeoxyribonuclease RuvC